jgi:quinol-cytochrome oxidoreductase complex cytochrome b subunit
MNTAIANNVREDTPMIDAARKSGGLLSDSTKERLQYWIIFSVAFIAFLIAAVVSRLLPWRRRLSTGAQSKSILTEALDASGNVAKYAFMG